MLVDLRQGVEQRRVVPTLEFRARRLVLVRSSGVFSEPRVARARAQTASLRRRPQCAPRALASTQASLPDKRRVSGELSRRRIRAKRTVNVACSTRVPSDVSVSRRWLDGLDCVGVLRPCRTRATAAISFFGPVSCLRVRLGSLRWRQRRAPIPKARGALPETNEVSGSFAYAA